MRLRFIVSVLALLLIPQPSAASLPPGPRVLVPTPFFNGRINGGPLMVANLRDGSLTPISPPGQHFTRAEWSPDAGHVAGVTIDPITVWLMRPDGSDAHQVLAADTAASGGPNDSAITIAWAPDNRHVAVTSGEHLVVSDLAGTVSRTAPIHLGDSVSWSGDGRLLAVSSNHETRVETPDGRTSTVVATTTAAARTETAWSPAAPSWPSPSPVAYACATCRRASSR